jgi:hypothetical protein
VRPIVVRDEEAPDDTRRSSPRWRDERRHVRRTATDAFDEFGIYTVSVFLALDFTVDEPCRDRPELQRYGKIRLTTAGGLRSLGFALVRLSTGRTTTSCCPTSPTQRSTDSSWVRPTGPEPGP